MKKRAVRRLDLGHLAKPTWRDDGTVRADAHLTRCGVFKYRAPDGSERLELREPKEVFDPDSLQSFSGVPVTNDHPPEMIDASNAMKYAVGSLQGTPTKDDDHMRGRLAIYDAATLSQMKANRKYQISMGYVCDVLEEPGVHPLYGRYDAKQVNIRGNHCAIVDVGRAGSTACIRLDAMECTTAYGHPFDACNNRAILTVMAKANKRADGSVDPDDLASRNAKGENDAKPSDKAEAVPTGDANPFAKKKGAKPAPDADDDRDESDEEGPDESDDGDTSPDDYGAQMDDSAGDADAEPDADDSSSAVDPAPDADSDDADASGDAPADGDAPAGDGAADAGSEPIAEDDAVDATEDPSASPDAGADAAPDASDGTMNLNGKLSSTDEARIAAHTFAVPGRKGLPIHDPKHTQASMDQFGTFKFKTPEEKHAAFNRVYKKAMQFGVSRDKRNAFNDAHGSKLDHADTKSESYMNELAATKKRLDDATKKLAKAEGEVVSLKKDLDATKKSVETVRKDAADKFDAAVTAKVELLATARATGATVDASMSDRAVMVTTVKHVDGIDLDDTKHIEYVRALWEGACARARKDQDDTATGAKALATVRTAVVSAVDVSKTDASDLDEEIVAKKMKTRSTTAWLRKDN